MRFDGLKNIWDHKNLSRKSLTQSQLFFIYLQLKNRLLIKETEKVNSRVSTIKLTFGNVRNGTS